MDPSDQLAEAMKARCDHFNRMARILVEQSGMSQENIITVLEMWLLDAYRDGARDMYSAVYDQLRPLWKMAGIES
jgi:hypothetical protein